MRNPGHTILVPNEEVSVVPWYPQDFDLPGLPRISEQLFKYVADVVYFTNQHAVSSRAIHEQIFDEINRWDQKQCLGRKSAAFLRAQVQLQQTFVARVKMLIDDPGQSLVLLSVEETKLMDQLRR